MAGGRKGYSGSSATEAIKDRISIADLVRRYVTLQRAGNRWTAPCPFHQETKASFSVNEEQGFFYCFGCQASGDIFDFYARINGLEFREALEQLAEEAGVTLEKSVADDGSGQRREVRKKALKLHEVAARHFKGNLAMQAGKACRDYLENRKLSREIIESFELGWSMDGWDALTSAVQRAGFSKEDGVDSGLLIRNEKGSIYDRFRSRLMFPIKNLSGQVIAFGGRIIDNADAAKYINSSDSPIYKKGDNLYGLFQARRSIAVEKSVLLTEGYMDVLTLHQFGYGNACGVLGTALTPEQVKRLGGFTSNLELIFDGDAPGRKAALRSAEMILCKGLNCKVVLLPEGEDIDSLLHSRGRAAFEDLRKRAAEGLAFCMRTLNAEFAPRDISAWVKNFLQHLELPELYSRFASELARGLGLEEGALRSRMGKDGGAPGPAHGGRQAGAFKAPGAYGTGRGSGRPEQKTPVRAAISRDNGFLSFAVRCPHYAERLAEQGLEFALTESWACSLWSKIISCSFSSGEPDILPLLDDKERDFWIKCRTVEALPPDTAKDELEFKQICRRIQDAIQNKLKTSRDQALSVLNGDDYENELLEALQEKLTGKPLVENKDE